MWNKVKSWGIIGIFIVGVVAVFMWIKKRVWK